MPELQITAEQLDEFTLEPPRLLFSQKDVAETVGSEKTGRGVGVKYNTN